MQTDCASNMRQVGIGFRMYADDNDGHLPRTTHDTRDTNDFWINSLRVYMGRVDEVRLCPADPRFNERLTNNGTSYIINEFNAVPLVDPFGQVLDHEHKLDGLHEPSNTMILFEIADDYGPSVWADHTHSRAWFIGWEEVLKDLQPDRHRFGAANEDHTKGSANYLFGDGHVESIKAATLKTLIDRGINFAEPPEVRVKTGGID